MKNNKNHEIDKKYIQTRIEQLDYELFGIIRTNKYVESLKQKNSLTVLLNSCWGYFVDCMWGRFCSLVNAENNLDAINGCKVLFEIIDTAILNPNDVNINREISRYLHRERTIKKAQGIDDYEKVNFDIDLFIDKMSNFSAFKIEELIHNEEKINE